MYLARSEAERCDLLLAFGKMACAGSKCLKTASPEDGRWQNLPCRICDDRRSTRRDESTYWNGHDCDEDWKDAIAALLSILEIQEFQKSSKPRVLMALTIRRVYNHLSDPERLDLEFCTLGQWLIASLNRSLRELRIAAGYVTGKKDLNQSRSNCV